MPSFNHVSLLGRLAGDPDLRYTPQGSAVCDFTVALGRRFRKNPGGEVVDDVSFVEVTVWKRTAEICAEYLRKGRLVHVSGSLKQDRWEDAESGAKRSKVKVVAREVQFIGRGPDEGPAPEPEEEAAVPAVPTSPKGSNGTPAASKSKR